MKIAIDYRDGFYSMYDPSKRKFADGVDRDAWMKAWTVEVSEREWQEYQAFLEQCRHWQARLCALDNSIHEREDK